MKIVRYYGSGPFVVWMRGLRNYLNFLGVKKNLRYFHLDINTSYFQWVAKNIKNFCISGKFDKTYYLLDNRGFAVNMQYIKTGAVDWKNLKEILETFKKTVIKLFLYDRKFEFTRMSVVAPDYLPIYPSCLYTLKFPKNIDLLYPIHSKMKRSASEIITLMDYPDLEEFIEKTDDELNLAGRLEKKRFTQQPLIKMEHLLFLHQHKKIKWFHILAGQPENYRKNVELIPEEILENIEILSFDSNIWNPIRLWAYFKKLGLNFPLTKMFLASGMGNQPNWGKLPQFSKEDYEFIILAYLAVLAIKYIFDAYANFYFGKYKPTLEIAIEDFPLAEILDIEKELLSGKLAYILHAAKEKDYPAILKKWEE